jgi:hypothetical protein
MENWLELFRGISAPPPDNRALFLDQFENIQEFAGLVYTLVDEHPPQLCDLGEEEECNYQGGIWLLDDCACHLFPQDSR